MWWGKRERAARYTLFLHKSIAISVNPSVYAIPFPKHTVVGEERACVQTVNETLRGRKSREAESRAAGAAEQERQQVRDSLAWPDYCNTAEHCVETIVWIPLCVLAFSKSGVGVGWGVITKSSKQNLLVRLI